MKKLPISIENEIAIRSLEEKARKTKSRILGTRHGDFILIEEPVFWINERISVSVEGDFMCSFLYDNEAYHFRSKIQRLLGEGLCLIDYPRQFQIEKIRRHHRIQVNLEAKAYLEYARETAAGTITDISEGGCQISVASMTPLAKNMICRLDFSLPDGRNVTGLCAKIRTTKYFPLNKSAEFGLEFSGPPEQLAKVTSFCHFCMFFRV